MDWVNIDPFIYWIKEREAIRLKRVVGAPPPWTDDPILGHYRFCNVRREDDKVTIWIRQNIREPYADHPALWWMLCAARTINWPDTLLELIEAAAWPSQSGFTTGQVTEVLTARKARGDKVYTGAYMIRAESDKRVPWFPWPKQRYIAEIVLGRLWEERALWSAVPATLQAKHAWLMEHRGWGPFMAYQAVVDMRYCENVLGNAPDIESWVAAGPGTIRGLNYLHERPYGKGVAQEQALVEIQEFEKIIRERIKISFDFSDLPNILCETSKWIKIQRGEGRVRSKYEPKAEIWRSMD